MKIILTMEKKMNNQKIDSSFTNNIIKRKKILVNKNIKLQKTGEKKSGSKTHINQLKKKKVYITILSSEKNENF